MKRIPLLFLITVMVFTSAVPAFADSVIPMNAVLWAAEEPAISFTVSEKITAYNSSTDPETLTYSTLEIKNNASPMMLDSISVAASEPCTLVSDSAIDTAAANSFSMIASVAANDSQDMGAAADNIFTTNRRIARNGTLNVSFSGKYVASENKQITGANVTLTFSKFEQNTYILLESDQPFTISADIRHCLIAIIDDDCKPVSATQFNGTAQSGSCGLGENVICLFGEVVELNSPISIEGSNVSVSGNLSNFMFSGNRGDVAYPLTGMFEGCTALVDAQDLVFPYVCENYCYEAMFKGCTNLKYAPRLPAEELKEGCYKSMFENCTSLETIPELPATTFAEDCCDDMFKGCTKLKLSTTKTGEYKNAYTLPTSNRTDAFDNMFTGTGGTFGATPTGGTTYYTSNRVVK